jgi:aspartyl-tRNA(Asn)/glutamyl-tRNA(Gln) amidotransferase subunit C
MARFMDVPSSPSITADEVRTIARLAHLDFSPEETDRLTRELARILEYIKQLQEVDTTAVAPTAHVQLDRLTLRDDNLEESLSNERALREAPRVSSDGFAVPEFVDEG